MDRESLNYIVRTVLQAQADAEKAVHRRLGGESDTGKAAWARLKSLEESILNLSV